MEMETPLDGLDSNKAKLARLRAIKGQLSRRIGAAHKMGSDTGDLLSELKEVSRALKSLEKENKQNRTDVLAEQQWVPPSVQVPLAVLDKPISNPIMVKEYTESLKLVVKEYLAGHPSASIWHRPSVTSFIKQTYGHEFRYLLAVTEEDKIVGVLPVVQLKSLLFGNFLVSLPYFNYGGVLADNPQIAAKLIEAGNSWRMEVGAKHLELRHFENLEMGISQRTDKVTFLLPLPKTSNELWTSFKPKLRAQVRRGEREMSSLEIGGLELLDDFYKVFSVNMRDLGTPVYGKKFFNNLLNTLSGHCWLVVARIDDIPVGCAFLTHYKAKVEIPWASTLRQYNQTAINMIMYWKVLEYAISLRATLFDFGRCSEDAGTYRFKRQWGAQPLSLYWDYFQEEGRGLPALNPDNPKLGLLIAAWKRMPLRLANLVGPHIVKAIP